MSPSDHFTDYARDKLPELEADVRAQAASENGSDSGTTRGTTWAPVDLGAVIRDGCLDEPPAFLNRSDGPRLLYGGKSHVISGEPESCKGWLAVYASAERLASHEHVLYVDFEDTAATIVARLIALGVDEQAIIERFHYIQPAEPLGDASWSDLKLALAPGPTLAVIDGVTEALALHGLELRDNTDVAKWLALLPRRLTAGGTTVMQIDHVGRDREARDRNPIGAQHKLAGIDVHYALEVIEPFGRGLEGQVKITVPKDRYGHVREHAEEGRRIADMRLSSLEDGRVEIELIPPEARTGDSFRPTALMERVSRAIEDAPGLSKNAVRRSVSGKSDYKDLALERLIAEGNVEVQRDGQARHHHSLRPFRQEDEE